MYILSRAITTDRNAGDFDHVRDISSQHAARSSNAIGSTRMQRITLCMKLPDDDCLIQITSPANVDVLRCANRALLAPAMLTLMVTAALFYVIVLCGTRNGDKIWRGWYFAPILHINDEDGRRYVLVVKGRRPT